MARFGVGQSARRKEDDTLLKGGGRFQDDIALDGEVHACFVRSPHAHADIAAVETAAAAAAPGVLAVYTGADVAADGLGTLPCVADAFVALKRPTAAPPAIRPTRCWRTIACATSARRWPWSWRRARRRRATPRTW